MGWIVRGSVRKFSLCTTGDHVWIGTSGHGSEDYQVTGENMYKHCYASIRWFGRGEIYKVWLPQVLWDSSTVIIVVYAAVGCGPAHGAAYGRASRVKGTSRHGCGGWLYECFAFFLRLGGRHDTHSPHSTSLDCCDSVSLNA